MYNVLRKFTNVGLVRRIRPAGRPGLYEVRIGDDDRHIVCRRSDAITDVDCAVVDTPCRTPADDSGLEIDQAEVIYCGRRSECIAATSVSFDELKRPHSVRRQPGDQALDLEQPSSRANSHQKATPRKEEDRRV